MHLTKLPFFLFVSSHIWAPLIQTSNIAQYIHHRQLIYHIMFNFSPRAQVEYPQVPHRITSPTSTSLTSTSPTSYHKSNIHMSNIHKSNIQPQVQHPIVQSPTSTSPKSNNTLIISGQTPKLATATPASAHPEAHLMLPPIDSAKRRRDKIIFPSQY